MAIEVKPDGQKSGLKNPIKLFLAGSIEQGKATLWHSKVMDAIAGFDDFIVFNPRRDNWNPDWEQSIQNPEFVAQVNWELDRIEASDVVFFYFEPGTMSPISLLELGLCLKGKAGIQVVICCPKEFWRSGNVELTAKKFGHGYWFSASLDTAIEDLVELLSGLSIPPRSPIG
jgi:hypothetical protein